MRRSAVLLFTLTACGPDLTLEEAKKVEAIFSETSFEASSRLDEDVPSDTFPDGMPLAKDYPCANGGTMHAEGAFNRSEWTLEYRACATDGMTFDGKVALNDRISGELTVTTPEHTGDCELDWMIFLVGSGTGGGGGWTAADGTLCGYDWIDDIQCPPNDNESDDDFCMSLRESAGR